EDAEGGSADLSLARFAVYRVERREAASMAALDRALYHDPLDTRALFFRGALRVRRGDPEGARTDLRRALDREPTAEPFAVALADLELDNGRPDEALVVLRNLIRHEPAHATSRKVREKWQKAELGLMQRADTVDALRPFRRSPEPDTRRALAYRLAGLENTEAEGLLRLVLEDAEASVRVSVLRLYMRSWLRRRLEEDAVLLRTVCGLLRADTAEGVRAAAAHLLGRVQQRVAAQALAGALAGEARDADPVVRQAAARALAGQDVRRATDALVEALLDEAPDVRRGAIDSLFRLTGRRGGYDPEADLEARRAAQAEWRAWCEKQRGPKAPPAEDDGPDR
nr:HEAT repeat domain-containing protein [Planctomycetota bacterium]